MQGPISALFCVVATRRDITYPNFTFKVEARRKEKAATAAAAVTPPAPKPSMAPEASPITTTYVRNEKVRICRVANDQDQ